MKHATYCGPLPELRGKGALVREDWLFRAAPKQPWIMAQFDERGLRHPHSGAELWSGWTPFDRDDFKVDQEQDCETN